MIELVELNAAQERVYPRFYHAFLDWNGRDVVAWGDRDTGPVAPRIVGNSSVKPTLARWPVEPPSISFPRHHPVCPG